MDGYRVTCWCCGEEGHYRDRCPKREKAFCRKCKKKGHFNKACTGKYRASSSRDSIYIKRARSASKDEGSRAKNRNRSNRRGNAWPKRTIRKLRMSPRIRMLKRYLKKTSLKM